MKNIFIHLTIIYVFSFHTVAQKAEISQIGKNLKDTKKEYGSLIEQNSSLVRVIKSYYVVENINQKFGGYTHTYEVSDIRLIDTYDLGPNNTRVITPRYEKVKQISSNPIKTTINLLKPIKMLDQSLHKNKTEPLNSNFIIPHFKEKEKPQEYVSKNTDKDLLKPHDNKIVDSSKSSKKYIYVYMIKTYERIAEKGYKSTEIFQKLGDAYFFKGEYAKAAKWYGELFKMTTTVNSEYYDRFVYSMQAIGEKTKANEIIKKNIQLSGIKRR